MFDAVNPRQSFPELERGILEYWRDEDVFRRSVSGRAGSETFGFYDGPPFATGLPHYGHLLTGTIKDVIPRYQTMRGKQVERRFGWDCHGLPVEYEIEKEHGIKGVHQIKEMGIATFNALCRGIVQRYTKEWAATVERMGRWVDMDNDYKTMDGSYMESIWWVFKQLYDKQLIYEGGKPMHICPRCATPLSNFEVTQGYKEVTDQSATVQCELVDESGTFLLAWTTTPWTLPGNLFLAVDPAQQYVRVRFDEHTFIVAEALKDRVFKDTASSIVGKPFDGKELIGLYYKPLFPYFAKHYQGKAFTVVAGDFVTIDDGTGIVHIAPGFGEDDFNVGKREGVALLQHVTIDGKFIPAVTDFAGMDVKPKEDPSKADIKIIEWLDKHGLLFSRASYRHTYPHCWRCDSPLLNYATSSWFVRVEKIKNDMLAANAQTEWVPGHLRDGRFGKWLEGARDWAISRNRYWGTPLPIWRSADGKEADVINGRDDLMAHKLIRFTKISVLRHGESEGNTVPMYQGTVPGTNLTERGREQAAAAGTLFNAQCSTFNAQLPSVIYCSPMARTMQTAQAISKATGAKVIVDERLREIDMGSHEGNIIPLADLALSMELRKEKKEMGIPQSTYHLPGMEQWDSVQKRMNSFFEEVLPKHRSEHIVIVSHADPMLNIRHFFTKEDPFKLVRIPHAGFATPVTYFWDHARHAEMDLHKDVVDTITWPGAKTEQSVEVTLVRHGETDLNKNDIIQGSEMDHPLNEAGHEQAKALAKTMKKGQYDIILSSHLKRAVETADYLAKALGIEHEEKLEILRERDLGVWTGKTKADVNAVHPPAYDKLNPAMSHQSPSGGESMQQFLDRAEDVITFLLQKYPGKRVLLVAHGGFMQGFRTVLENRKYSEALSLHPKNTETVDVLVNPPMQRVGDVLDCWFESGSMPYAQSNFPFNSQFSLPVQQAGILNSQFPPAYPADFIAEGIDQTRGWFYTLTVLAAALYRKPAFYNCVVNGTVLAEDGRKMSKRLKNYPDPTDVIERHGADALRFSLMNSPAVRAEDLRFSERAVEEAVRSVLLPLWNSYSFFVTYANAAQFEATTKPHESNHPLDRWIKAEVQDLVNRMTEQLDRYDLSATCSELFDTIDALTNWYIRLSRRRFAAKGSIDSESDYIEGEAIDQHAALTTLYEVLITVSQLLAPFCPFVTEAIYLNLVPDAHGSIHLTDWPEPRTLKKEEQLLIKKNRMLRMIVSLGNKIRSEKKMKVRQPLAKATIAAPESMIAKEDLTTQDLALLRQELNVKEIAFVADPVELGSAIALVDARKVGPRLGGRVQEIIQAGKRGDFALNDGFVLIMDEKLSPDEVQIVYRGRAGEDVLSDRGIIVSMNTNLTQELILEGHARDLIRCIQKLRKENGYALGEHVQIGLGNEANEILEAFRKMIEAETNVSFGDLAGVRHVVPIADDLSITIFLDPKK